jgi:hypothetical protein
MNLVSRARCLVEREPKWNSPPGRVAPKDRGRPRGRPLSLRPYGLLCNYSPQTLVYLPLKS